jgi:hypothetical protein
MLGLCCSALYALVIFGFEVSRFWEEFNSADWADWDVVDCRVQLG